MKKGVLGIHHITGISGTVAENVNFYTNVLGLKLVKKTVNYDDPHTYHLYYADDKGTPGSVLTFFPWGEQGYKGRKGTGQATTTGYSLPSDSLGFWLERLTKKGIHFAGPFKRFGDDVILLEDPDNFETELVFSESEKREGWKNTDLPDEHSIRGFFNVTLSIENKDQSEDYLTSLLGFRKVNEEKNRFRYESGNGGPGTIVDLLVLPDELHGRMGVGAIHHVAWRAEDENHQLDLRKTLEDAGAGITPVIDRNYFRSVYFREPGHVLYEIATDPPGFTVDEELNELGRKLMLPPWLESRRKEIESVLPEIKTEEEKQDK